MLEDDLLFGEDMEDKFDPEFIDNMGEDVGDLLEHFLEEDESCAGDGGHAGANGVTNGRGGNTSGAKKTMSFLERGHRLPSHGHFRDCSSPHASADETSNIDQQLGEEQEKSSPPIVSSKPLNIQIKKRNSDTRSLVEMDECLTPTKKTRVNLNNVFGASSSPHQSPLRTDPLIQNGMGLGAAATAAAAAAAAVATVVSSPSAVNHHSQMNGHPQPHPRPQAQQAESLEKRTMNKSFLATVKEGGSKSKSTSSLSLMSAGGVALDDSLGSPGNTPGNYGLSPTSLRENGFEKPAYMLKQNGVSQTSSYSEDKASSLADGNNATSSSPPAVQKVVSVRKLTEKLASTANAELPNGVAQHILETSHQGSKGGVVSVVKASERKAPPSKAVVLATEPSLDAKVLRKYTNGSEEARYHIKNMAKNLREEYFKLIDSEQFTVYDLDNRSLQKLTNSNNEIAMKVVRYLQEADLDHIRNKSAYLERMINRENNRHEALKLKSAMDGTVAKQFNVKLASSVEKKLASLIKVGQIQKSNMDGLLMENLASLPESAAMGLLLQLESIEMSKIRNFKAFFLSLSKKHMRDHMMASGSIALSGSSTVSSNNNGRKFEVARGRKHHRRSPGPSTGAEGDSYNMLCSPETYRPMKDHSLVQRALGVRTDELHGLSTFACMVPGSIALHMQNMHDQGIEFVTLLDDRNWKILAELEESLSMALLMDVGKRLKQDLVSSSRIPKIRNVNAFFLDLHRKILQKLQSPIKSPEHHHHRSPMQFQPREPYDPKRFDQLCKASRNEIDMLIAASNGILRYEMFDPRCIATLKELSSHDVKLVCSQFRKVDMEKVRNPFAFFVGMCRNHLHGARKK